MASEQNGSGDGKVVDLKKGGKTKVLQIRAKGERFRRAGLTFGREPAVLKLSDVSKDQVAALKAEPQLVVEEVEV